MLGDLLRRHRVRARLTQHELADRAGLSIRALRDLEHGRVRRPRADSVRRLAAALGLSDADRSALVDGVTPADPAPAPSRGEPVATGWSIDVLGPLVVRDAAGDQVEISSAMQCDLLGLLALQPGRAVPHDQIVDMLWSDRPPKTADTLVHVYISQLRRVFEPGRASRAPARVLATTRGGYILTLGEEHVDVARFDALYARARQAQLAGDLRQAAARYEEALRCWRGPVLAGAGQRLRQHPAAVAVAQRRVAAAIGLADAVAAGVQGVDGATGAAAPDAGVAGDLPTLLRESTVDNPLHEGLHARLIVALARSGDQATALRLFADLRQRLRDELGVEPGAELRAAHLQVLRGKAGPDETPAAEAGPGLLPPDVPAFTGRLPLLARLDEAAAQAAQAAGGPLVISGAAGVGKTSLAVHWAHRVRERFPDGQLYLNLRGYANTEPVRPIEALGRFLHALGVPPERVPVDLEAAADLYRTLLAGRRVLVVLDNARHPEQIRPLLPGGPACLVVVTSRDRLAGLIARDGAVPVPVDVFEPDEATALLTRVLGGKAVDADPEATAELARRCAYLPLALRVVAANLLGHPYRTIAGYLSDMRSGDALGALEVHGDEQAAVRAAFDLSYAGLPPPARRLFRRLGLTPGPDITAAAAGALAGVPAEDSAWLLGLLADAHLVTREAPDRYAFHDLLRLYARERAEAEDGPDERDAAVSALLHHYLYTVEAAVRFLYPGKLRVPLPQPPPLEARSRRFDSARSALSWLEDERPNLVAVAGHAAAHGPYHVAWGLSDLLRQYYFRRSYAIEWLSVVEAGRTAAAIGGDGLARATAEMSFGYVHTRLGDHARALEHMTKVRELAEQCGWVDGIAAVLGNMAIIHAESSRFAEAAALYARALDVYRELESDEGQAVNLSNVGLMYLELDRREEAAEKFGEALEFYRRQGSFAGIAHCRTHLGEAYTELGRLDEAAALFEAALPVHREYGNRISEEETLRGWAECAGRAGDLDHALQLAEAAYDLARDVDNRQFEEQALGTLGAVRLWRGEIAAARHCYDDLLGRANARGRIDHQALALVGLAEVEAAAGDPDQARRLAQEALGMARRAGLHRRERRALDLLDTLSP